MRERHPSRWTEFKETAARRFPDKLYATINSKGEFVINLNTYVLLNKPQAVVLLYDRETRTIGVKPSHVEVPNAILVRRRHDRYNRVFRCKPFLVKHGIDIQQTVQFPTAVIDTAGILILNLREMVLSTHMPRKNTKRR